MRVCIVHSFYSSTQPSGENTVVDLQVRTLRRLGHDVHLIAYRTDELSRARTYPVMSAVRVATGRGGSPLAQLASVAPDVVHVHNLFPNAGTAWLSDCPYPLVMTLHNFRPVCATATLYRDGHACRECLDRGPHRSIVHGCYRGSRPATVPLWLGTRAPRRDALLTSPDVLITLSPHARAVYEPLVGRTPVECLPNPVDSVAQPTLTPPDDVRWLFAGRLTPEKGVLALLAAWPAELPLDVAGHGPDRAAVEAALPPHGRYLGQLSADALRHRLPHYTGLVFPSLWPEGAPMIYVEALASAVPTLALRGNSVADNVIRDETGVVVDRLDRDELRRATNQITASHSAVRARCKAVYDGAYTPDSWAGRLLDIYAQAAKRRADRNDSGERSTR